MTDTANLEDGFYWVRKRDNWEIVFFDAVDGAFFASGTSGQYPPKFFDEINPRPIKREDVK